MTPPPSVNAADQLTAAATAAQGSPVGRARLALAMAFLNVSPWGGSAFPGLYDYLGQEQGQYQVLTGPISLGFTVIAREQIEAAAGGDGSGTVGINFARLLYHSSYYPVVRALYNEAGLSLPGDLETLARHADIRPDAAAYRWLEQTSVPTGVLQVPELDLKTISDQLVPVQQESYYHALVAKAGDSQLLRQAFVAAQGHCNFTPAELIAGVQALASRVTTGSWGSAATAAQLDTAADALPASLGGGAFTPFWPDQLTGAISPFGG